MYLFTLSFSQANSNEYTCIFTLVTHGVSSAAFPPDRAFHPAAPLLFLCRSHSSFERRLSSPPTLSIYAAHKRRGESRNFPLRPLDFSKRVLENCNDPSFDVAHIGFLREDRLCTNRKGKFERSWM